MESVGIVMDSGVCFVSAMMSLGILRYKSAKHVNSIKYKPKRMRSNYDQKTSYASDDVTMKYICQK